MTNWGIVWAKMIPRAPLKGISPFASKISKSILSAVCHTSVMTISLRIWCSIKWYLLVWWFSFFSLNCCLTVNWYCYEKLENQSILRVQILSLIQSSAHLMIIPWFPVEPSWIFFSFHSEIWRVWRKWRRVWEWERKRRKRKWECQPSHNGATIKEKKGRPPRIKVWG